jgi:hypothetical protein
MQSRGPAVASLGTTRRPWRTIGVVAPHELSGHGSSGRCSQGRRTRGCGQSSHGALAPAHKHVVRTAMSGRSAFDSRTAAGSGLCGRAVHKSGCAWSSSRVTWLASPSSGPAVTVRLPHGRSVLTGRKAAAHGRVPPTKVHGAGRGALLLLPTDRAAINPVSTEAGTVQGGRALGRPPPVRPCPMLAWLSQVPAVKKQPSRPPIGGAAPPSHGATHDWPSARASMWSSATSTV